MFVSVIACALCIGLLLPGTITHAQGSSHATPAEVVSGEILVRFQPGTTGQQIGNVHAQLGGRVQDVIAGINVQVVAVPAGQEQAKVQAYSRNPNVEFAEPNGIYHATGTPDDPRLAEQWQYENTGQSGGKIDADIDAFAAWDVTGGSETIAVAILDTGIDHGHVDFHDGTISKITKWVNFTSSPTVEDVRGHGTHVAGTVAAATNNGAGVAGSCPDCVLYNVKVLGDDGGGSWDGIAKGINWSADNGAKVVNMSLGGSSGSRTVQRAVDYAWNKGVVLVAAAGNNGSSSPHYPAYYTNVIAVAATDHNDVRASFSNYGSWVDVAAPGANILSTTMSDTYGSKSGTSMATPHVAGLAGLLSSTGSTTSNSAVQNQIEATADDIAGTGTSWTHGRINACAALSGTCDSAPAGPNVSLKSPKSGTEIADVSEPLVVEVQASTQDPAGLTEVAISIDGGTWQLATHNTTTNMHEAEWVLAGAKNGPHTIRAKATDSSGTTFADPALVRLATPVALPGSFEAEDYRPGGQSVGYNDGSSTNDGGAYWNDGVDKESCADSSTCYNVGWITNGEWLAYDVSFDTNANYALTLRVASVHSNATVRIELQAEGATSFQDISGPIAIPNTGGWQTWTNLTTNAFPITAGSYTLRFVAGYTGSNPGYLFNFNAVTVMSTGSTPSNTAPTATDVSTTTDEDMAVPVILSGSDADGDSLTYTIVSPPTSGTLSGTGANLTYTPNADVNGADSFTYTVNDGTTESAPATASISINQVNDVPVAQADAYSLVSNATLVVATPGVLGNDTDVDGDALSAVLESGPTQGTLTLNPDGSFTYVPAADYTGSDSFVYHATDGTTSSAAVSVSIDVATASSAMRVSNVQGSSTNQGGSWTALVTVTVVDGGGNPLNGAQVSGNWGSAAVVSCQTGAEEQPAGTCQISKSGIAKKQGSVTFTVDLVTLTGYTYEPENSVTTTTVVKP